MKQKRIKVISKGYFFKREFYGLRWYSWIGIIYIVIFLFFMR